MTAVKTEKKIKRRGMISVYKAVEQRSEKVVVKTAGLQFKNKVYDKPVLITGPVKLPQTAIGAKRGINATFKAAAVGIAGPAIKAIYPETATEPEYIDLIRKRVTKKSVSELIEATDIPVAQMAEIMEITPRKLAAIKPNTLMERSQSEKVLLIARLYSSGEEVFGSRDEFNKWMNGRVPALGKKKPKEYLDTTTGINMLMDELLRIQHGVYS